MKRARARHPGPRAGDRRARRPGSARRWPTLLDRLGGRPAFYKVGLELFIAEGERAIELVPARGGRVFLDLKLHDIPETVARAVASAARVEAELLTVHTSGGYEMLTRAAEAARGQGEDPGRDRADQPGRGRSARRGDRADDPRDGEARARVAARAGIAGLVCSPQEIEAARGRGARAVDRRSRASARRRARARRNGDQKRVATRRPGHRERRRLPGGRGGRCATRPIRRRRSTSAVARSRSGGVATTSADRLRRPPGRASWSASRPREVSVVYVADGTRGPRSRRSCRPRRSGGVASSSAAADGRGAGRRRRSPGHRRRSPGGYRYATVDDLLAAAKRGGPAPAARAARRHHRSAQPGRDCAQRRGAGRARRGRCRRAARRR